MNEPTTEVIFVDVDEVLVQWVSAALQLLDYSPSKVYEHWDTLDPRPWDLTQVIETSPDQMWHVIDRAGASFWAGLEPFSWMRALHGACTRVAPTYLLTSPSLDPSCYAGKVQWMHQHFGREFQDFFIGSNKQALARAGAVLIDDSPKNCQRFEAHGGKSILFPGVGNSLHAQRHDPLPTVYKELF